MKMLSFVIAGMLYGAVGQAQSISYKQVPAVVLNAFQQKFPKAKDVDWEKRNSHYDVSFELGWKLTDHEVWIAQDGKILRHSEDIKSSDLPRPVREAIKTSYKGFRIDDADRVTKNNEITYRVELERGNEEHSLEFRPNGTEIN